MSFGRLSLSRKIVLLALATSLLALLTAFTVTLTYDYFNFRSLAQQELDNFTQVIAEHAAQAMERGASPGADSHIQTISNRPSIDLICIYEQRTAEQVLIHEIQRDEIRCPERAAIPGRTSGQWSAQDINTEGASRGRVLIHLNNNYLLVRIGSNALLYLLVLLLGCVLAALAAQMLARKALQPLHALSRVTRQVADGGSYTLRVPQGNTGEVGDLANAFNHMLSVIQQENRRLTDSERKFRLISERSRVGILQLSSEGQCIYANDEMLRITDCPKEQLSSQKLAALAHPDDRRRVQEQMQRLLEQRESINLDCCLYLPDGETRWISGHIAPFSSDDGNELGFLGTISDITELRQAYDQLEQMAFYDTLTGLANRRLFRNRLEHMLANIQRSGTGVALILIDLDHFKHINDTLGHDSGDLLLSVVSERLKQCVRFTDTVARLGGDEFAVILPNVSDSLVVSSIAEKILSALAKPVLLDAHEIDVRASLGISIAPSDTDKAETLIKNADLALYRAKDEGRNNFQFFTTEMNTLLVEHLKLVQDLRQAVEAEDFALHFQPQVHLATGELVGFEALLRWQHPERGAIPPQTFIPVAEDSELIIPLGRWILATACRQMGEMCQRKWVSNRAVMTVNLSIRQLQDHELTTFIAGCLEANQLRPGQLELELTETLLMENLESALDQLQAIKHLGVSLSIDDFGTGYSSLGYLKRLPVNVIKVDRSFVTDIPHDQDDMEITAAVIAMAHKLRYKVVAEGIETAEQYRFLREADCDFGQGYYISRPLPSAQLESFCLEYQQRLEAELAVRK